MAGGRNKNQNQNQNQTCSRTKPADTVNNSVNKTVIEELMKSLSNLLVQIQSSSNLAEKHANVDPADIPGVLTLVLQTVTVLTDHIKSLGSVPQTGGTGGGAADGEKARIQEDELDECRQRALKGNLIVSSLAIPGRNKVSLLKTEQQLSQDKQTITEHIIELVKEKLDVPLSPEDIQACHRLPNNSVLLRIWNRKEGSSWSRIVDGIKSGKNSEMNVFFNFHLTRRRSSILYQMRQMKKSGKIAKFFSDEKGQLTVMVKKKEDKGVKVKLCYWSENKDSAPRTFLEEELVDLVDKTNSWSSIMENESSS